LQRCNADNRSRHPRRRKRHARRIGERGLPVACDDVNVEGAILLLAVTVDAYSRRRLAVTGR
jgi:hypothetical protein